MQDDLILVEDATILLLRGVLETLNVESSLAASIVKGFKDVRVPEEPTVPGFWTGFDLDRTLTIQEGFADAERIGPPQPAMLARLRGLLDAGVHCKIFTARVDGGEMALAMGNPVGHLYRDIRRMRTIVQDYTELHAGVRLEVTNRKDFGCQRIFDDIARQVIPNTGIVVGE